MSCTALFRELSHRLPQDLTGHTGTVAAQCAAREGSGIQVKLVLSATIVKQHGGKHGCDTSAVGSVVLPLHPALHFYDRKFTQGPTSQRHFNMVVLGF